MDKKYLEPKLLFRYLDAEVLIVSTAGEASTITFKVTDHETGKKVTRWVFYDADKFDGIIREAIVSNIPLSLLVGRYIDENDDKDVVGTRKRIEDRILEVWKTM